MKESEERFASHVFQIRAKETIPSDGMPHKTIIASMSLQCEFEYITTPKLSPYVYIKSKAENNNEFPLLPARLNIFLSNNYIGESLIKMAVPREKFEVYLGIEEGIKVKRTLEDKKDVSATLRQIHYAFQIKLENLKKEDIKLTVLDQIPIARDVDINVEIQDDGTTKPTERSKDGLIKWVVDLKSREFSNLNLRYRVYFPMGKDVRGLE
jgi:uncharacterized protein (TIGR02231 family)